jgi:hypothetical protein
VQLKDYLNQQRRALAAEQALAEKQLAQVQEDAAARDGELDQILVHLSDIRTRCSSLGDAVLLHVLQECNEAEMTAAEWVDTTTVAAASFRVLSLPTVELQKRLAAIVSATGAPAASDVSLERPHAVWSHAVSDASNRAKVYDARSSAMLEVAWAKWMSGKGTHTFILGVLGVRYQINLERLTQKRVGHDDDDVRPIWRHVQTTRADEALLPRFPAHWIVAPTRTRTSLSSADEPSEQELSQLDRDDKEAEAAAVARECDQDQRILAITQHARDSLMSAWAHDQSDAQIDRPRLLSQGHSDTRLVEIRSDSPMFHFYRAQVYAGGVARAKHRVHRMFQIQNFNAEAAYEAMHEQIAREHQAYYDLAGLDQLAINHKAAVEVEPVFHGTPALASINKIAHHGLSRGVAAQYEREKQAGACAATVGRPTHGVLYGTGEYTTPLSSLALGYSANRIAGAPVKTHHWLLIGRALPGLTEIGTHAQSHATRIPHPVPNLIRSMETSDGNGETDDEGTSSTAGFSDLPHGSGLQLTSLFYHSTTDATQKQFCTWQKGQTHMQVACLLVCRRSKPAIAATGV